MSKNNKSPPSEIETALHFRMVYTFFVSEMLVSIIEW